MQMRQLSFLLLAVGGAASIAGGHEPARLVSGEVPTQPIMVAGGGQVLLELSVDESGGVVDVATLRSTPPFTTLLRDAVAAWRFAPARTSPDEHGEPVPVASKVLVAGLFRPPTLFDAPSLGPSAEDVGRPSEGVPFPTEMVAPAYPLKARIHVGAVTLVEAEIDEEGSVEAARLIRSVEGLNRSSSEAARAWRFRPARLEGQPVASIAYIVLGFRDPVAPTERSR